MTTSLVTRPRRTTRAKVSAVPVAPAFEEVPAAAETPADDDTVATQDLLNVVRTWANRGSGELCDSVEGELQRRFGLKFAGRLRDYETGGYEDKKDRLILRPGQPERLSKAEVGKALKQATLHWGSEYRLDTLVKTIKDKFGIEPVSDTNKYKFTWTVEISGEEMERMRWDGTPERVNATIRYSYSPTSVTPTVEVIPQVKKTKKA
jgi:hypothetical protein